MALKYNVRIKVVCIVILIKVNISGINYYRLYSSTYFQVELWTIFNSSHVITCLGPGWISVIFLNVLKNHTIYISSMGVVCRKS